ncbi:MAG: hypothetical protein ACJ8CB_14165 [Ktedonobacteraceae bacterium]
MGARLRSGWQKIKQHRVAIAVVAIVFAVVIVLIIAGYWFDWLGFKGYDKVSIATETTSTPQKVTKTVEHQPGKTLWDWMELLIIPIMFAIAGFWLNQIQKSSADGEKSQESEGPVGENALASVQPGVCLPERC